MNKSIKTDEAEIIRIKVREIIRPIRHGLLLSMTAIVLGILWATYLVAHHEQLHGGFEKQEAALKAKEMRQMDMKDMSLGMLTDQLIPQAHAHGDEAHEEEHTIAGHNDGQHEAKHQHSHSGSLAMDAMQRLLRAHIHWMGLGILSAVMLLITAFTSLKTGWKKTLGWTFGIGTLVYPVAWIVMGFRTVVMGPDVAEASIIWLFGPSAGLLLVSLIAVFSAFLLEMTGWHTKAVFPLFFEVCPAPEEYK